MANQNLNSQIAKIDIGSNYIDNTENTQLIIEEKTGEDFKEPEYIKFDLEKLPTGKPGRHLIIGDIRDKRD